MLAVALDVNEFFNTRHTKYVVTSPRTLLETQSLQQSEQIVKRDGGI